MRMRMRRPNIALAFLLALGTAFSVTSSVWAQSTVDSFGKPAISNRIAQAEVKPAEKNTKSEGKPGTDDKAAKPKPAPQPVSKERSAELMKFVKTHHPELEPLLGQLQSKRKKRFQSVLRKLDEDVKRLKWLEKKFPARHERALAQWVVASKIQFLTAQLSLTKSENEEAPILKKIRALFEKEHELQKENTMVAIEAAKKKHEKLIKVLKDHEANRDSEINKKLNEIAKASQRKRNSEKKKSDKKAKAPQDGEQKKNATEVKPKPAAKAKPSQESKPTEK